MLTKSLAQRKANTPEAKAARTEAARAKKSGKSVVPKTGTTEETNTNTALAKQHKVAKKKLEDAATVLKAAEDSK